MNAKRLQRVSRSDQQTTKASRQSGLSRNGSALLIVIGTLALIAVFAAVYISIGRTDRRSARAVLARKDAVDTTDRFGEYLSGVIGIDRLVATVQYGSSANSGSAGAYGLREMIDIPYTDWTRRSAVDDLDKEYQLFLPSGKLFALGNLNGGEDFRVASDPWLASTTPVYLGNPGIQNVDRPFSQYKPFVSQYPNEQDFLDNRDWLQISNFAPDGRFVNLFNLRPNRATGFSNGTVDPAEVGGFSAEPGVGTSPDFDGRQIRRMSNYLSLWDLAVHSPPAARAESLIQTFDPMDNGDAVWVPGQNTPVNIGETDLWNIPAVWTMYQRYMLMPMNQPFITINRRGDVSTWADPDYPAYQYADADGDGMADSRWMELTAARDKTQFDTRAREDIESFYSNKDYRYFIAARAVDLSSMVNVNTATDLLRAPTIEYPMGLTPADVDLRRLLTMQDPAGDYRFQGEPLSYSVLHRPYISPSEPALGGRTPSNDISAGRAQKNFERNVTDYWMYNHLAWLSDLRTLNDNSNSMLIGRFAYEALRQGITHGSALGNDHRGHLSGIPFPPGTAVNQQLLEFERDPTSTTSPSQITAEQRYNQYRKLGGLNPTDRAVAWSQSTTFGSGLYGLDDLAELLTFHGLNDPEVTTRLERVTSGRYESLIAGGFNDVVQAMRLGPLGSNRPLALDREQHGIALSDINDNPATAPSSDPALREVNGRISFNSMAQRAMTPRTKMTTISGAVPFRTTDIIIDPSELEGLTTLTAAPDLSDVISDANALYALYSNALVGEINAPKPINFMTDPGHWQIDPVNFASQETSTLFYGHRGPELALRIAAHVAVNEKDLVDDDTDPTIATLILDNGEGDGLRTFVQNNNANVTGDSEYSLYPGAVEGNLFDPGLSRLATSNLPLARQAVNVYGFEATPILTEVSVMYIYNDAPENQGELATKGDMDSSDMGLPRYFGGFIAYDETEPTPARITIDNSFDRNNANFLGQVLAFQLHNPYDQPISLGGTNYSGSTLVDGAALTQHVDPNVDTQIDTNSNYLFDYYIEYAGRFFKVAKYIEWYPTDENGENYFAIDQSEPAFSSTVLNPSDPGQIPQGIGGGGVMIPGSRTSADAPGSQPQAPYDNFITRNVVLQPGQTRVFYVIADRRFDDEGSGVVGRDRIWEALLNHTSDLPNRFKAGGPDVDQDTLPDGGDGKGWTGPAEEWIEHQFRVKGNSPGLKPIMMCEFDPVNGQLVNESSSAFTDLTVVAGVSILADPSREDATEVRLWKKIVTKGEETTDVAGNIPGVSSVTSDNLVSNDLLVDRIELGATGLAIPLPSTGDVAETWSYPEDYPEAYPNGQDLLDAGVRNDNTGVVVARWKTIRRADSSTLNKPSVGQVTPWMLRSRAGTTITQASHEGLILEGMTAADIYEGNNFASQSSSATIKGDYEIQEDMRAFFDLYWVRGAGAGAIIQTAALEPHLKSDVAASSGFSNVNEDDVLNNSLAKFPSTILTVPVAGAANLEPGVSPAAVPVPEILVDGSNISSKPRLADLFMAWGIGATYAPDPTRVANSPIYVADEWMTATEAMAVALGYDNPVATTGFEADSVWQDAYNQSTSQKQLLDDGHLVLDDFVSYLNSIVESPPEFTVSNPPVSGDDIPRGTGVPMALGVIDQARAVERVALSTDPTGTLSARDQLELLLSRPTMGTININTAPIEVLRLLPGLTPSRQQYSGGATGHEWWGTDLGGTNLPNNTLASASDPDTLYENPDVAAAILAYRDRTYGVPNTAAMYDAALLGDYDIAPLNFGVTNVVSVTNNMRGEDKIAVLPVGPDPLDRSTMTGIDGLRQAPGFGSLGELLAVRVDPEMETTDIERWNRTRHLSIDQYGYDQKFSGKSGETTIMSQLFGGNEPGDTTDDYAEKLAMANSVLGTLSVRSDFYAVWFVIQGYQESDVANLRPEDPLIPTVRKRYLMVIDRSNVIEPGDKPKVLLMKELPI